MAAGLHRIRVRGANEAGRSRIPFFVGVFNPIAHRLLGGGLPLGPNGLLTVAGRRSGLPRTTPVAVVEVGGRRWVTGTFGEVQWVRNLRAAGQGRISLHGLEEAVIAVELSPAAAAEFFRGVLAPYIRRIPLGTWLIRHVLEAADILDDPAAAARAHPVFELVRADFAVSPQHASAAS